MNQWRVLKSIIGDQSIGKDIFLTLIDGGGNILCTNSNMQRTLHLKNPRQVPSNFFHLLHPDHIAVFRQAIDNSRREKTPWDAELYLKNGYYHAMKWQISCLNSETDSFLCIGLKTVEDTAVTTDTVANIIPSLGEVSGESDTVFRSFMNNTPNLAWVLDEHGTLLYANEAFYQYFVITEANALNKNIIDIVPNMVAETFLTRHFQVLKTGCSVEAVEKVKWSDGTNFNFHVNIFPIGGSMSKKLVGGHAVNLADKYEVEKQLREANDRLLMLSRATSDAIWEWDMQTGYIFRNDVLMNMIGYQVDDAKGLSWWLRRIHPEDRNRVTDKIKEATDKGHHSWEDEYRFKCSDGSYKHIQDRGYVVYENGLPVKMIGSLQDITEIKDLENQLITEKLQRQKEISETVIRVQEKERTRIGHELHDNVNQILSTTKMFVEMLTPDSEEQKKIKEKSIEYLLTSIEEIRKLSKELVIPYLKEKGLIESIVSLTEDIQMSGKLQVNFTYDQEIDLLSPGKKITIFRIIQEQVKNILNYSKATQVDIDLLCEVDQAQLVIRDNGVGFDPKQTHRGIGLSNIHDRTRFYNGTVNIDTSPGNGCTITVLLPFYS